MKNKFYFLVCLLLMQVAIKAQMKIGDNPTNINAASLLELETTNKGLVLPRVGLTALSSSSPLPAGLLTGTVVFNTASGVGSGVGLYYWNGSAWIAVSQNVSSTAWSLTGNSGTNPITNFIGTTNNVSMRFRTNNIQRMMIDSLGDVAIGSEAFDPYSRERLLVDYGTTTSHTVANFKGKIDGYLQMNMQNLSNGVNASTDYVATADDGTDSTYFVDMGINSSTYAPSPENWGNEHDAYLYCNSKNLLIGTQTINADVVFLIGGGRIRPNAVLRLSGPSGNIVVGYGELTASPVGNIIRGPNASNVNIAGGNLTLQGGTSTGTTTGASLNLYGGASAAGQSGAVNIIANPLSVSGVQTTSTFTTDSVLTIFNSVVKKTPYSSLPGGGSGNAWLITGNNNVNSSNFLGTTDPNTPLIFKVGGVQAGYLGISSSGITTFGVGATAGSQQSTALGTSASATGQNSTALGAGASAGSGQSTAIGTGATASQQASLAVGYNAIVSSQNGVAIGTNANTSVTGGVALGFGAIASSQNGVAIGSNADATTNPNTLALGTRTKATGQNSIAVGNIASAPSIGAEAFGNSANATGANSMVVGNNSTASGDGAISIGDASTAAGANSIVLGNNSSVAAVNNSIVLGTNSSVLSNANSTILIGDNLSTAQSNVLILGNSSKTVGISTTTPNPASKLDVNGTFKLGAAGTVLTNIIKGTVTVNSVSVNTTQTATISVTLTGANPNATVIINPRGAMPGGVAIAYANVSGPNTITIAFISNTSQIISSTFDVTLIQ